MQKLLYPHDSLCRQSMGRPAIALDWLRSHLPPSIWQQVEPHSLSLMATQGFLAIEHQLQGDLVYRLTMKGNSESHLYLLLEHQSTPDRTMAIRMLEYSVSMMKKYRQAGQKPLPLVLPFCLYHGKETPYPFSTEILDCFEVRHRDFVEAFLKSRFALVDLSNRNSEHIHRDGLASFFQHLLKCKHEKDHIAFLRQAQLGPVILELSQVYREDPSYMRYCVRYILQELGQEGPTGSGGIAGFLVELLPNEIRSDIMTFAQQLRQEGRREGLQQGLQQGRQEEKEILAKVMFEKGFSLGQIEEITNLSAEQIQRIFGSA